MILFKGEEGRTEGGWKASERYLEGKINRTWFWVRLGG